MENKEKKLIGLFMLLLFFTQIIFVPVNVKAEGEGINVEASSAILIEPTTGKILYEKNSHEKLAPASVTKIMTMLIAMEAVDSGKIKLTDKITVSENAKMKGKNGNSSMLLDTGEIRTVEEILKGIAIASGNDAATAMAEYIAGSEEAFVKLMNERAQTLGMKDTTFKNCSGLSESGHVTSAFDISLMSKELLKHPQVLKYTGTYMETISEGRKSPIGLVNHNKLVRFFKGCDGLKTGFTNEAMYCISATAVRDGVRMLAVIMGAPTYKVRNRDASMLMNYGFSKFECKKVVPKDSNVEKIQLGKREDKFFMAKALEDINIIVERGTESKITKKCVVNLEKKHYNKGDVVGNCEVYLNGNLVGNVKIYCDREIKKPGVFDNFRYNFKNLFNNGI
ncbi:D-alanyl-D-alanine carboxypeptidase DacF precursor [Clostridium liquoris]|uniref:serine-type D-Ala-D-Ala carboxypeptidase n=1 Tax=Clostridium liquoris TaxID=1289519 RepID=A0A2T0B4J7_9CLOT|nr:D-alanyl-D-alanine carboxypeptidase family protein [Clostridium liquoris]PRR78818.1 D-alanyl-D-alanine carboxypeptidase DacF precursor [Clostridium liquoris]